VEDEACGGSKSVSSRSVAMVMSLVGSAAPIAAFVAITETAGGPGLHRAERSDSGRSAAEDGGRRLFCLAMQSRALPGGGKWPPTAVAGPGRLPSDRPLEGRERGHFPRRELP
jgi:hypothetical protein